MNSRARGFRRSERRHINIWLLIAGVLILAMILAACCSTILKWFGRKEIEKIEIVLTGVDAVIKPPLELSIEFTCELRNGNPTWVDMTAMDYCVEMNDAKVQCGKYPDGDAKVRVAAGDKVEARVKVFPTAGSAQKVLETILHSPGVPTARVVGTAHIKSPVGTLDFEFQTRPIKFELRRGSIRVELPGFEGNR